jgi:cytidine deaminase
MSLDRDRLKAAARQAAEASYSPYSRFRVGAALLASDGSVITGTNVENRSYGLTICAERSAVVQAVSRGLRSFAAVAVHCPDSDEPVAPCGACRQVLSEFAPPETPVLCVGRAGELETTLGALYPFDSLQELKGR